MSETILKVEKRDDGVHYVEYFGRELGVLTQMDTHPEENYLYGFYERRSTQVWGISLKVMETPRPPKTKKPKRSVAKSLGLRRPK